jgi:hypothetical protein
MTLHVSISPQTEAKLREKAAAVGVDVDRYAAGVLERAADQPLSIEAISGPIGKAFESSGLSEDQLTEMLERAKHDERTRRRAS